ncbi:UNVERIFIED_CONTAM: Germin-like protein subfamily 1 member 16 [Sesamum radiatum]|uniref:Germin-like protein subfamily 1 member 16 n=1 Tax=Sesamum radiatum TaxID=300843 RepID=A0AAW2N6M3_SESRA
MAKHIILLSLVALSFGFLAFAFEPSPLQDFCVADSTSSARVNGQPCKSPALVQASDFSFSGLHLPGNTSNPQWLKGHPSVCSPAARAQHSGISMVRYRLCTVGNHDPPHTRPRRATGKLDRGGRETWRVGEVRVDVTGSREVGWDEGGSVQQGDWGCKKWVFPWDSGGSRFARRGRRGRAGGGKCWAVGGWVGR